MNDLLAIRAALAKLAGLPKRVMRVPPAARTYYVGALGWVDQLIGEPWDTGDGGLMEMPDVAIPYAGLTADLGGVYVQVPEESLWLDREELPESFQTWLAGREETPP